MHDESAVAVGFLGQRVKFGDRIVEGLLGQMAGAIGRIQDLVVEYGEVECEAETDWVRGSQLGLRDIGGILDEWSAIAGSTKGLQRGLTL